MKITLKIPLSHPLIAPKLIGEFIITKMKEVKKPDCTEPSPVLISLCLSALACDLKFYDRFKDTISASSKNAQTIFDISQNVFLPVLGWSGETHDLSYENSAFSPCESDCRRVLRYSLRQGRKMLTRKNYEFIEIFKLLVRAGLQPFLFRLYQFEAVCESSQADPENLLRQRIDIVRIVAYEN